MLRTSGPAVRLTSEQRAEKIRRYRAKRDARNFKRTVKYQCRKTLADSRPRVRGRFARNNDPQSVLPHESKKAQKERQAQETQPESCAAGSVKEEQQDDVSGGVPMSHAMTAYDNRTTYNCTTWSTTQSAQQWPGASITTPAAAAHEGMVSNGKNSTVPLPAVNNAALPGFSTARGGGHVSVPGTLHTSPMTSSAMHSAAAHQPGSGGVAASMNWTRIPKFTQDTCPQIDQLTCSADSLVQATKAANKSTPSALVDTCDVSPGAAAGLSACSNEDDMMLAAAFLEWSTATPENADDANNPASADQVILSADKPNPIPVTQSMVTQSTIAQPHVAPRLANSAVCEQQNMVDGSSIQGGPTWSHVAAMSSSVSSTVAASSHGAGEWSSDSNWCTPLATLTPI